MRAGSEPFTGSTSVGWEATRLVVRVPAMEWSLWMVDSDIRTLGSFRQSPRSPTPGSRHAEANDMGLQQDALAQSELEVLVHLHSCNYCH